MASEYDALLDSAPRQASPYDALLQDQPSHQPIIPSSGAQIDVAELRQGQPLAGTPPASEAATNLEREHPILEHAAEAAGDIIKGIPSMVTQTLQAGYEGAKFAAGGPQERAQVIGEALKQAIPQSQQIASDVQQPAGSREWFRGMAGLGMLAAPAIGGEIIPGLRSALFPERPPIQITPPTGTLSEALGFTKPTEPILPTPEEITKPALGERLAAAPPPQTVEPAEPVLARANIEAAPVTEPPQVTAEPFPSISQSAEAQRQAELQQPTPTVREAISLDELRLMRERNDLQLQNDLSRRVTGTTHPAVDERLGQIDDELTNIANRELQQQGGGELNASQIESTTPPDGGVRARSELGELSQGNVEAADARLRSDIGEETAQARQGTEAGTEAAQAAVEPTVPQPEQPQVTAPTAETPTVTGEVAPQRQAAQPLSGFEKTLSDVQQMKDKLKARTMIYQADAKENLAALLGQPRDTFYHLPYEGEGGWKEISGHVKDFENQAEQAFHERRAEIPEFSGMTETSKLGEIWNAYKNFTDRTGEKTPLSNIETPSVSEAGQPPVAPIQPKGIGAEAPAVAAQPKTEAPVAEKPPVQTTGTGISSERFGEQYGDLAPVANTGRSAGELKAIGQSRLDNFQKTGDIKDDPYAALTNLREGKVPVKQLADDVSLLRAEHQRLRADATNAEGTPQWAEKSQAAMDMAQAIKEVAHGPASDMMRSFQEYDQPKYDNVTDFDQAVRERLGRESTPTEQAQFKKIAGDRTQTRDIADKETADAQNRIQKYRGREKLSFEDAAKNIHDQLTELLKDCVL